MPRLDVWSLALSALLLSACSSQRAQGPGPKQAQARPGLPEPGLLAERWLLPSRFFSGATRQEMAEEQLMQGLVEARVVYVSESHRSPHHHAVQLRVIDRLRTQDPSIAIGLEMVKRPYQAALDSYVAGQIDEAALLAQTEWDDRWGFDFGLYRPIFEYARTHKIRLFALNMRDEITRKVSQVGIEGLTEEERKILPELDLNNEEHKEAIRASFGGHHGHGNMNFDNFYAAQVIWDETMAHEVARILIDPAAPKKVVVLAGSGHVHYGLGIPMRAARRGAKPYKTVTPVLLTEGTIEELMEEPPGDFVWIMGH